MPLFSFITRYLRLSRIYFVLLNNNRGELYSNDTLKFIKFYIFPNFVGFVRL